MTDYTKLTDFAAKDSLLSGNPAKVVRGTEIDAEFTNIAVAVATKTDDAAAAITGGTIDGTPIGGSDPDTGAFTTISASGQVTSTVSTGTAPLVIASTTKVANLNVDQLDGADWASPGAIGSTTPAAGSFTTLSATGNMSLPSGGQLIWGGAYNYYVQSDNSSYLRFATNGNEVARFDASGNFGIGTSSPVAKLDVYKTATVSTTDPVGFNVPTIQGRATTASGKAMLQLTALSAASASSPAYIEVGSVADYRSYMNLVYSADAGNAGYFAISQFSPSGVTTTERLRVDYNGNLGLGVTPSAWNVNNKTIDLTYTSLFTGPSGYGGLMFNAYRNAGGTYTYRATEAAARYESALGSHNWYTAPSGTAGNAITWTQALTLEAAGHLLPGTTDNVENLGSATYRWATVYAGTGTINTSDAREKTAVSALTTAEINAAKQLSKEIGTYKFLASVQAKGDAARTHVGMTVQRAIEIMESHGLSPFDYGFICHDVWEDKFTEHPSIEAVAAVEAVPAVEEVKDEDGNVITEAVPAIPAVAAVEGKAAWSEQIQWAGDRYAFRYDQLNLFIAAGIEARLAALEAA